MGGKTGKNRVRVLTVKSYMPFSFGRSLTWTMQLKAWVATDVTIKSPELEREFSVNGYGAHIVQVYSLENIQQASPWPITPMSWTPSSWGRSSSHHVGRISRRRNAPDVELQCWESAL